VVQVDEHRLPVRGWIVGGPPGSGMGEGYGPRPGHGARFRFTRRPGYEPARRLTFRSRAGKDAVRSRLSSYTRSSIAPRNAEGPR
jgi:hypothetical protein